MLSFSFSSNFLSDNLWAFPFGSLCSGLRFRSGLLRNAAFAMLNHRFLRWLLTAPFTALTHFYLGWGVEGRWRLYFRHFYFNIRSCINHRNLKIIFVNNLPWYFAAFWFIKLEPVLCCHGSVKSHLSINIVSLGIILKPGRCPLRISVFIKRRNRQNLFKIFPVFPIFCCLFICQRFFINL